MEEDAIDSPPQAHFIVRINGGKGLSTPDRPAPVISISFSFGGTDHETETVTGTPDPEFKFQKEFNLDATEDLVRDLLCNPVVFKIFDTKPVGKTQEKINTGKATISLQDLVFWKSQSEDEEMAGIITMQANFPVPEFGENAYLNVFFQAPDRIIPKEQLDSINIVTVKLLSLHALPPTWGLKEGEDPVAIPFAYTASYSFPMMTPDSNMKEIVSPPASIVAASAPPSESGSESARGKDGSESARGGAESTKGDESARKPTAREINVAPTDDERRAANVEKEGYSQRLVWNHVFTSFLGSSDVKRLKIALTNPLELHLKKGLKSGNPYPYTRRYHGVAKIDVKGLLQPGKNEIEGRFEVVPAPDAEGPLTDEEKAIVPDPNAAPAAGAKGAAAAKGAAGKGGKGAGGPEFEAEPPFDPEAPHPFIESLTYIKMHWSFLKPLVPAPPPPRRPLPKVSDLIPHRPYLPPHKPPVDASEEFCKQLSTTIEELADEYTRMFEANGIGGVGGTLQSGFGESTTFTSGSAGNANTGGGGGGGAANNNNNGVGSAEERRQRLAFHLTKSGAYYTLKERLKFPIQKIVRERFHKSGTESKEELMVFSNELYVYLCTLLNQVLNRRFEASGAPATGAGSDAVSAAVAAVITPTIPPSISSPRATGPSDIAKRVEQHRKLAEEAEMILRFDLAAKHHTQRVVLCNHREDLWYDFGAFCMRTSDFSRAEECLREAIALNPKHLYALLTYGSLICTRDKIASAETYFIGATEAHPDELLPWALLGLFYDMENRDADRRRAFKQLLDLERRKGETKRSAYVRAASFLNTIHCTQLVERALSQELLRSGETVEIAVLLGTAYLNRGDHENARKHLNNVLKNLDKRSGIAMCLMGHSHFLTKQVKEAVNFYEQALALRNPHIEIALYMRLAALYAGMNKQFEAKDYFLRACKLHPTASSWLGLGVACYNMNQFGEAEEALAEANILDSHNPEVWGWLAILALKTGKVTEAEASYKQALKHNIATLHILREIGRGYLKIGKFSTAESALKKALFIGEDAAAFRLLGDILLEQKNYDQALESFEKAVNLARSGEDRRYSIRQLVAISKSLNRAEEAAAYSQLPDVVPN